MSTRASILLFAIIGMVAIGAAATNSSLAHHDIASAHHETDQVEHLIELAYRSCFGHGDDLPGLQEEARAYGWKAASDKELKRNESTFSEMIGGWVFSNEFGSFAIMQSKFKDIPSAHICTVTAKLTFDRRDHVKASFERRFATTIAQEADSSGKHIDCFLLKGPRGLPVAASITYFPSKGALTISMVHGRDGRHADCAPGIRDGLDFRP